MGDLPKKSYLIDRIVTTNFESLELESLRKILDVIEEDAQVPEKTSVMDPRYW